MKIYSSVHQVWLKTKNYFEVHTWGRYMLYFHYTCHFPIDNFKIYFGFDHGSF